MKQIEIIELESNVFGFSTHLTDSNAFDYLSAFFNEEEINNIKKWMIKQGIIEFAILRNIYVDENNRNTGLGRKLVSSFISQSCGVPILLLASPDEEGFLLQEWYEKMGFELTHFYCEDGPLMIKR